MTRKKEMSSAPYLDDLEQFEGGTFGSKSTVPKVRVLLNKNNKVSLYFSSSFIQLVGEHIKGFIKFSYGKKSNILAFEFVDVDDGKGCFKFYKNCSTHTISLESFAKKFELNKEVIKGDYLPMRKEMAPNKFLWIVILDTKWE